MYFENKLYLRICDALDDAEDSSQVWITAAMQHDCIKRVILETKDTKLFVKRNGLFRRDFALENARTFLEMPTLIYSEN
jgi:hypothetical protein